MQKQNMEKVEDGIAAQLWVNGASQQVRLVWVSKTHFELVIDKSLELHDEQLTALVVRSFLSLPARVELAYDGYAIMRFEQEPHNSVIDLLAQDLLESCIEAAQLAPQNGVASAAPLSELQTLLNDVKQLEAKHRQRAQNRHVTMRKVA